MIISAAITMKITSAKSGVIHSSRVTGSILSTNYYLYGVLPILHTSVWIFYRFLQAPESMCIDMLINFP